MPVTLTCMTTKKKFDIEDPEVIQLKNGRYAYKAVCPWPGKVTDEHPGGKPLSAFKFASAEAFKAYSAKAPVEAEKE
jgi:hypothetical protein